MMSAYGILVSIGWCSATDNSPLAAASQYPIGMLIEPLISAVWHGA